VVAAHLAEVSGVDARYAREWCEQQAAAGFLAVDDATAPIERLDVLGGLIHEYSPAA
jgi:hypothetical protein